MRLSFEEEGRKVGSLQVNLSDDVEVQLDRQMRAAGFEDRSAYVEALLKADRRRLAQEKLEAELLRGLDSGPSEEMTDEVWARIDREVERRLNEGKAAGARD